MSYYSWRLGQLLETEYARRGISDNVVAYRALNKGNYHFSADALRFAKENAPCKVLAFDVSGFFDNLDHALLKRRLKSVLAVSELPDDWFKVFRYATRYRHVSRDDIASHTVLGPRMQEARRRLIATVAEVRAAGLEIRGNPDKRGIPQGTPISSTLANLYMLDFDQSASEKCARAGAFYRRYSDDVIIICMEEQAASLEAYIVAAIRNERLHLNDAKTERTAFGASAAGAAQYLGFQLRWNGATIRPSSLARQMRKLTKAVRRTRRVGSEAVATGRSNKIYTRKLRKRFAAMPSAVRNFSAYARRSADVFSSAHILRQVRRLERRFDGLVRSL